MAEVVDIIIYQISPESLPSLPSHRPSSPFFSSLNSFTPFLLICLCIELTAVSCSATSSSAPFHRSAHLRKFQMGLRPLDCYELSSTHQLTSSYPQHRSGAKLSPLKLLASTNYETRSRHTRNPGSIHPGSPNANTRVEEGKEVLKISLKFIKNVGINTATSKDPPQVS